MGTGLLRILNLFVEPWVRAGIGSPGPWPTGAIVLETRGRTSGRLLRVPLLAALVGDLLLVGTVCRRSQWIQNVAHAPRVRYWMRGRPREATALVVAPDLTVRGRGVLPSWADCLLAGLAPVSHALGISFVILGPATPTA